MGSHAVLGISAAFWTLAALYSLLLHRLTSYTTPAWWYLVVYACAAAMGYFIHYAGHQRWVRAPPGSDIDASPWGSVRVVASLLCL